MSNRIDPTLYGKPGTTGRIYADRAARCSLSTLASANLCRALLTKAFFAAYEWIIDAGVCCHADMDGIDHRHQLNVRAITSRWPSATGLRIAKPEPGANRYRCDKDWIGRHVLKSLPRPTRAKLLANARRSHELNQLDRWEADRINRHHYVNADHVTDRQRHDALVEW